MIEGPDINAIERNFQEIPHDKTTEAAQTSFLANLGWHDGLDWDDLMESKRILIISEAGAGKTYECRQRSSALWRAGEAAFYLELADLARNNLRDLLLPEEEVRFDDWYASRSDLATFFLDSIDELELSLGSFRLALTRLAKATDGRLGKIRVVITSRPIPIDKNLVQQLLPIPDEHEKTGTSEDFSRIVMARREQIFSTEKNTQEWRNVALLPLSNAQIKQMAVKEGVDDPDEMLADIQKRNAEEFVRRPQDLIELCADWRQHRRIRSHLEQVASNISVKLKPREDRGEKAALSADKAFEGAQHLALAASLSRKLTLRHSANSDRESDSSEASLDPQSILKSWTEDEWKTLLERPLFGMASYGRVRFHHRSVIEYLSAERLITLRERGMPIRSLKRILFATTPQGDEVVKPSLRPIAAWIGLRNDAIFEEVLRREPDVLLNFGDPESLSPNQRRRALRLYVERHAKGGWRGLTRPGVQLHRFAAPELGPEVNRLWQQGVENPEIREILLNLIGLGKMTDCADIAYEVVVNAAAQNSERIDALDALIHLDDSRLCCICRSLIDDSWLWPNRLSCAAVPRLFPTHLSVELLCQVLTRVTEKRSTAGHISWHLPRIIEHCDLSAESLDELRNGLTELVTDGLEWREDNWPHLISKRQFLLPALSATCLRALKAGVYTPEVMNSTGISLRLAEQEYDHTEAAKQLGMALPNLPPAARRLLFECEDAFLQSFNPETDSFSRFARLAHHYGTSMTLTVTDTAWIISSLADRDRPDDYRAMLLEAAIRIPQEDVEWTEHLARLKPCVADLPDLVERIDRQCKPLQISRQERRRQKAEAKRDKQRERRDAKARASWVIFQREVNENLDAVFAPDRSENTAWNLWRAMERSGDKSYASGWNRRFIERHFDKEVADRLRLAIMAFWRNNRPTLRSERPQGDKDKYVVGWKLGLAGVAAEAEDTEWAEKLSEDEAELALRYVPIEVGGFPAWLERFAYLHPVTFDSVLGTELTAELDEPASGHSAMLHDIQRSSPNIARLFVPRLLAWLDAGDWRPRRDENETACANRLREVVQILTQHGDADTVRRVHSLARTELSDGVKDKVSGTWLPILMRLCPDEGVGALARTIESYSPAQFGPATDWFSSLFSDRHGSGETYLYASGFTPELLLRLARLAYQYIRPSDDLVRYEGSYTPNARDDAERGRQNIVHALLSRKGPGAWVAKMQFVEDPLFATYRYRALRIAHERAAEETDAVAFSEADIVALDRYCELPPITSDDMFALLSDRLDDLDDMLMRDHSPRAVWALIEDEKIMRRQISHELKTCANGVYTVDQEAVTADEKETDIRLRSTGSEHEAVIELKIGGKPRSAADLKAALKDQLVIKYMAPESSRSGCLLITTNSSRRWEHPETGSLLDFAELITFLNEEAAAIEREMGGSLRLTVRGLDLRSRLSTERV